MSSKKKELQELKKIQVNEDISIYYDPESYAKQMSLSTDICPHMLEARDQILEACKPFEKIDIQWDFEDFEISCLKCLREDKDLTDFWLTEILHYLKGAIDFERRR